MLDYDYITNRVLSDVKTPSNPYNWYWVYDRSITYTTYFKIAGYSMYNNFRVYDSIRGLELLGYFDYYSSLTNDRGIDTNDFKLEGSATYYVYYLPIIASVFGGFDRDTNFTLSGNSRFGENHFLNMVEYASNTNTATGPGWT